MMLRTRVLVRGGGFIGRRSARRSSRPDTRSPATTLSRTGPGPDAFWPRLGLKGHALRTRTSARLASSQRLRGPTAIVHLAAEVGVGQAGADRTATSTATSGRRASSSRILPRERPVAQDVDGSGSSSPGRSVLRRGPLRCPTRSDPSDPDRGPSAEGLWLRSVAGPSGGAACPTAELEPIPITEQFRWSDGRYAATKQDGGARCSYRSTGFRRGPAVGTSTVGTGSRDPTPESRRSSRLAASPVSRRGSARTVSGSGI